ncbi:hypothetical protein D3C80_1979540 [compost metagenome]
MTHTDVQQHLRPLLAGPRVVLVRRHQVIRPNLGEASSLAHHIPQTHLVAAHAGIGQRLTLSGLAGLAWQRRHQRAENRLHASE